MKRKPARRIISAILSFALIAGLGFGCKTANALVYDEVEDYWVTSAATEFNGQGWYFIEVDSETDIGSATPWCVITPWNGASSSREWVDQVNRL